MQLSRPNPTLFVVDTRNAGEFRRAHIRGSITVPSLLLKRVLNGKIRFEAVIKCADSRSRFLTAVEEGKTLVVYANPENPDDINSTAPCSRTRRRPRPRGR